MLPSMPLLFICPQDKMVGENNEPGHTGQARNPSQDIAVAAFDSLLNKEQSSDIDEGNSALPHCESDCHQPLDEKDYDGDLLFSTEIPSEKRKYCQGTGARKKRKIDFISRSASLIQNENFFDHFAEAYFLKARNILSENLFTKFLCVLGNFDPEAESVCYLHQEIDNILKGYPLLLEEFIGFLLPHQALECKQLTEALYFEKTWTFFKNADVCHLNRIIHIIEQLSCSTNVSLDCVRNSILPLLKGHPNLAEIFHQLLPLEKPSSSSLKDFEEIRDYSGCDGDWERIRILHLPDRACGNSCGCVCHNSSMNSLCISCNIKFSNGHVYVQYGRVSRFARVQFKELCSEEILRRLNPALYNKHRGKTKGVQPQKGSLHSSNECGNMFEADQIQHDMTGGDNDDIIDEDILVKQECEDFGYFDLGDYNEDDVIKIDDDDDDCEDDDKVSETSSGEGDKSMDSGAGDFMFDELGCNEDDYVDDDDDDDEMIKDLNFNDSSSETLDNKLELLKEEPSEENESETKEEDKIYQEDHNCIHLEHENNTKKHKLDSSENETNITTGVSTTGNTPKYTVTNCFSSIDLMKDISKEDIDSIKFMEFEQVNQLACNSLINFCDKEYTETVHTNNSSDSNLESNPVINSEKRLGIFEMALLHDGCSAIETVKDDIICLSTASLNYKDKNEKFSPEESSEMVNEESNNIGSSGWTRAEDKVILEAFQKELDTEHTFSKISCIMPSRSVSEIQGRFQVLMKLLEKVASGAHETSPLQ